MSNLAMMMGLSSGAGGVDVADVFSTYLYTTDGNNRDVVNGVDLAGEGGLVWFKPRNISGDHALYDTERGVLNTLSTNATSSESSQSSSLTAFNSDGYTIGTSGYVNYSSGYNYVSWTWRKAPKFFDVVKYSGTGSSGHVIDHALNNEVGMILIKNISAGANWKVWHRSLASGTGLVLNSTNSVEGIGYINNDNNDVTDSSITIGVAGNETNTSGNDYIMYLFAHNEDLISCGSFSGNDATVNVTLGFQPQFIIVKNSNTAGNWNLYDSERGAGAYLFADANQQEYTDSSPDIVFNSTGFDASGNFGVNGRDYIYMAIKAED